MRLVSHHSQARMAHSAAVAGAGITWRAAMTRERWQEIKRVLDLVGEASLENGRAR